MIDVLWDGERFFGLVPETCEKVYSDNVVLYMRRFWATDCEGDT
jgi:hypothetical protein